MSFSVKLLRLLPLAHDTATGTRVERRGGNLGCPGLQLDVLNTRAQSWCSVFAACWAVSVGGNNRVGLDRPIAVPSPGSSHIAQFPNHQTPLQGSSRDCRNNEKVKSVQHDGKNS